VYPCEIVSYSGFVARITRFVVVAAAAVLAVPALAHAQTRTLTFTTGPISVPAYGVAQQPMLARSPAVDGYVVGMEAEVVDAKGRVQGRDKVMLHHIVFAKVGVPDYTCGGAAQRFFAEGEERLALSLPGGYGYPNKATDQWGLLYMLMNHKPTRLNGYIRYRVRYVTGERLTAVKPIWLDVRNCTGPDPVFDAPGGGKRFSTFTETTDFRMPESGRLVAGGGHLHGGGIRVELRNASCHTTPFTSRPTWGGPLPKPILHEPGPTKMSSFRSTQGIPVAKGQTLRLAAVYDNGRPHTRAMGIMLLFLAPDAVSGCGSSPRLTVDLGRPAAPPPFSMPLPRRPTGRVTTARSTWVGDFRYGVERISLKRGTTFTWRFKGTVQHDVTVVGGPEGFSAPWTLAGSFKHRFTKPGTYRLFCSLHPAKMVQQITVR
jgi:plastocyanin